MTPTEQVLWKALRNHQLEGLKFRRQRPIGPYVVDFSCLESRLIIELDGPIHDTQVEYDEAREDCLRELGYRVLRFRNEEVWADLGGVLERIGAALTPCRNPEGTPPAYRRGEIRL